MTDLATLTEGEFWPLIEQARDRVLTNDVDALEALIVAGLPPEEMQAAAWALVQRVRGLRADLMRVQRETQEAREIDEYVEHESFVPQEGDRAFNCDADDCRLAPHMAKSPSGAYRYRGGKWVL